MKLIIDIPEEVVIAIQNGEDYRYDIHTAIAQGKPFFPFSEEVFYKITDAEWEHSDSFWVTTPSGKKIEFEKKRPQGECRTCKHRDPEDKKCDCRKRGKKMKTRLDKSIEYIRGYCSKISSCSECKCFDHRVGICSFKRMPMLWETLQEQEKEARFKQ